MYQTQKIALDTEFQGGPSKHVLIDDTKHVSRIEFARVGIQKIIRLEHAIPGLNPVIFQIICCLHVTVHAEKSKQTSINGVVESCTVQGILALLSHEGQICSGSVRQIDGLLGGVEIIVRLAPTT